MNPRTLVARLTRSRSLVVLLAMLIALTSIGSALAQVTVSGNIAPAAIEIDTTGAQRANL